MNMYHHHHAIHDVEQIEKMTFECKKIILLNLSREYREAFIECYTSPVCVFVVSLVKDDRRNGNIFSRVFLQIVIMKFWKNDLL